MTAASAVLVGALLLAWPAFANLYPILFSDTGGLLQMGLEGSMGWDKPFVYGPLIAASSLHLTLWLAVAVQALLVSYTLWALQLAFADTPALRHVALCFVLAVATAAPWFTSTLMPDALTPVAALALVAPPGRLSRTHRIALTVLAAVAIAAHLSHLILAAALLAALALLRRTLPVRPAAALGAALVFLLGSNWVGHGRLAVSPYGAVFALARLVADGPARDYLDRVCPDPTLALCNWRDRLTSDSDQFLWDPQGPFWADPAPLPDFAAQASRIVAGTVRTYPLRVATDAIRNAAAQLVRVDIGDTLVADYLDAAVRPRIERWFGPAELRRYDGSRQRAGQLPSLVEPFLLLHRAALAVGLLGCALILLRSLRRPSPRADLAALLLIAAAANALSTGALSTVHDRYEARLAWIVLLPLLLRFAPYATASAGTRRTSAS